jgi:hypothetical protein
MRAGLRRWAPIGLVVAIVLVVAGTIPVFQFCDGNAPGWVENRGGCASWTLLENVYPWHWGTPHQCLGMCGDLLAP